MKKWRIEIHPRGGWAIRSPYGRLIRMQDKRDPLRYRTVKEACQVIKMFSEWWQ